MRPEERTNTKERKKVEAKTNQEIDPDLLPFFRKNREKQRKPKRYKNM